MTRYAGVLALVVILAAGCGAGDAHIGTTPTTRPAPVTPAARPLPVAAPDGARPPAPSTFWRVTTPSGASVTLEKYDASGPGLHPTVVLLPGSPGWGVADEEAAARWAAHGFTAVAACWFRISPLPPTGIDCPDGPPLVGVSTRALPDVHALVEGVKALPGVDPTRVALVGFSRGGGMAALYATNGGREPVVAVSGLFDPATFSGRLAEETNVIPRATGIRAPVLLQYGADDGFVPWQANSELLGDAIRRADHAPAPEVIGYPGGHGIASDEVIADEYRFVGDALRAGNDEPAVAQYP